MTKSDTTLSLLEDALQRLINGQPQRISKTRRISVRAVEEEAGKGDGSAYYYADFIEKIKKTQIRSKTLNQNSSLDEKLSDLRKKLKKEMTVEDWKQIHKELKDER